MRIWFALVFIFAVVPVLAVTGVEIAGVTFACNNYALDNVCPEDYWESGRVGEPGYPASQACTPCDADCAAARRESCPGVCNNNNICELLAETCASCDDCISTCGPRAASFGTPLPASPAAVDQLFTITLNGQTNSTYPTMTLTIAVPPGVIVDTGTPAQAMAAGSGSNAITVRASTNGVYTFTGSITDARGTTAATNSVAYTVYSNIPPNISFPVQTLNAVWGGERAVYAFTMEDNTPDIDWYVDFGDGVQTSTFNCAFTFCDQSGIEHVYAQGVTYTARIVVTDSEGATTSYSFPQRTAVGLPAVTCTPTGNATYTNDATQCAANCCAGAVAGWQSCFSIDHCLNNNICVTEGGNPPQFVNRDNSTYACTQGNTTTCTNYQWASLTYPAWTTSACIGDDANEYPTVSTYPAGFTTSCTAPGMCYTTAGSQVCVVQQSENTEALCSDGLDNNCNGLVDRDDSSCNAVNISGFVEFRDENGPTAPPSTMSFAILGVAQPAIITSCEQGGTAGLCYVIPSPRSGNITLVPNAFGFESQSRSFTLEPGDIIEDEDFVLSRTVCNADCTNSQGFCDASCIGVGACQPTGEETRTLNACHPAGAAYGLRAGQEVILDYREGVDGPETEVGLCCSVPPQWRTAPQSIASANPAFGKIDTLVRYTSTVIINGRPYKLVINTW